MMAPMTRPVSLGLLAPVDQIALIWGALLGNLKNRLLGMGAKLGPVIAPKSSGLIGTKESAEGFATEL